MVLVHAAAGGVGSFAVQWTQVLGATVIGTASESNHDFLRDWAPRPSRTATVCPSGYAR